MRRKIIFISMAVCILSCGKSQKTAEHDSDERVNKYPVTGSIERLDDQLNTIVAEHAQVEILSIGYEWSEGPLWVVETRALIFSDVPENKIYKWTEEDSISIYLDPAGNTGYAGKTSNEGSNGLLLNNKGRLVLCQHGDRRIAMMDAPVDAPAAKYQTIVDRYNGKRLNSPNDACYDDRGNLYFTDPPFGLEGRDDSPHKELDFNGVFLYATDDELTVLVDTLTRPNGIGLSPDQSRLVVANADPERAYWAVYDVLPDGALENGRILKDATSKVPEAKGLPDGLKISSKGILYATGPGGVWIMDLEGHHYGTIKTGKFTSNCTLSPDESVLYLTSDDQLQRVVLK